MSLKFEVDSLDGLDEGIAGLYEQHGDKFRLKVEGIDPADELKEALRKEREERKAAKERAEALEREARERAEEAAAKSGDIDALRESFEEKLARLQAESAEAIKVRDSLLLDRAKNDAVAEVAKLAIAGKDKGLRAYLANRIKAELKDGQVSVTVLDESGRPSASTIEDLRKEIESDVASWGDVIAASYASGGGAAGSKGGGAAKTWDQLSGMERVELRRSNPAEHARLKKAHEAANKR